LWLTLLQKYDIKTLKDGWNTVDGEKIFFISNPAVGLWVRSETALRLQSVFRLTPGGILFVAGVSQAV